MSSRKLKEATAIIDGSQDPRKSEMNKNVPPIYTYPLFLPAMLTLRNSLPFDRITCVLTPVIQDPFPPLHPVNWLYQRCPSSLLQSNIKITTSRCMAGGVRILLDQLTNYSAPRWLLGVMAHRSRNNRFLRRWKHDDCHGFVGVSPF